jgi:dihydrofolate reductase
MAQVSAIAAIGKNRVLGKDNQLLWQIPDDLRRFKQLTFGHPVVMGRKTFESIVAVLGKPLSGRTNVVVTRDESWQYEGVLVAGSIEEAIGKAKTAPGGDEVFIGGGGEIYRQALPFTDKLYLTLIDDEKEGDSFFPEYEDEFKKVTFEESREHEGLAYRWVDLER